MDQLVTDTPPITQPQRFGNKAFKLWYDKLEKNYDTLISEIADKQLSLELKNYFLDCFGSSKRLDYGTGHELNFLCILLILFEKNKFDSDDFQAIVHHVFYNYINFVRKLQITYNLEPAGAHGVWGLDEYHFLPFIFGASELIKHPEIKPSSIEDDRILNEYSDTYMYISCIKYIKQVIIINIGKKRLFIWRTFSCTIFYKSSSTLGKSSKGFTQDVY